MPESRVQYQVERNPESHFVKGQSGNPVGKPQGCQSHASRTAEILLDGQVEALTPTGMARALEGDGLALRLCLDRIIARRAAPARCISICRRSPSRPTSWPRWPRSQRRSPGGVITPGEGAEVAKVVDTYVRATEASDFDRRLKALEAADAADA